MKFILKLFLSGLAALIPTALTLYLVGALVISVDNLLAPVVKRLTGFSGTGVGFLGAFIFIIFFGLLTKNWIGQQFMRLVDYLLYKVPFINVLYKSVKEITTSVFNKDSNSLGQSVLVLSKHTGHKSFGFLTQDSTNVGGKIMHVVFVPTAPNPTSGMIIAVEDEQLTRLQTNPEDLMKLIISVGMIVPSNLEEQLVGE